MKNEKDRLRFMSGVVSVSEIVAYLIQDRYLNLAEAAKYTSISARTIRARLDEIPHRRVGTRMLLFKKSELDTWLDQYREGGKAELDELVEECLEKVT